MYVCPVCAYPRLNYPPSDFVICPSCGTEFGYHDTVRTYSDLRMEWIANGMVWHSHVIPQPGNWNPLEHLIMEGYLPVYGESSSGVSEQQERIADSDVVLRYSWA